MIAKAVTENGVKNGEGFFGQILGGRHAVEQHRLVARQAAQEFHDRRIACIGQKRMIPEVNDMLFGERFDFGKIHHHAVGGIAVLADDLATERDLQRVTMPVQMSALALVVGDAVSGIEFKAAGDEHCKNPVMIRGRIIKQRTISVRFSRPFPMLTIEDHNRDVTGMTYVYPVISRRAGGVSIGINLNPNNACNWACVYCQVPGLTRGGPPPVRLELLESELRTFLREVTEGDFMLREVPAEARRLVDVAFSGNGEPTSASGFDGAVCRLETVLRDFALIDTLKVRLITNGSLLHRTEAAQGIARIGALNGEVWFKLDRATVSGVEAINNVRLSPRRSRAALLKCAELAPTWIQTCWFALDGKEADEVEQLAYLEWLASVREKIRGVHLYGVARPSLQAAAPRLSRLPVECFERFAGRITALGIPVLVNP